MKNIFTVILLTLYLIAQSQEKKSSIYTIKTGDNLYRIAVAHQVTRQEIKDLNPSIKQDGDIKIGQKIKLPIADNLKNVKESKTEKQVITKKETTTKVVAEKKKEVEKVAKVKTTKEPVSKIQKINHEVAKGETMYSISKKMGVTVAELQKQNNLTDQSKLKIGQILTVKKIGSTNFFDSPIEKVEIIEQPTNTTNWSNLPIAKTYPINSNKAVETIYTETVPVKTTYSEIVNSKTSATSEKIYHSILPGETLEDIAQKYNATPYQIREWNGISHPSQFNQAKELIVGFKPLGTVVHATNSSSKGEVIHTEKTTETIISESPISIAESKILKPETKVIEEKIIPVSEKVVTHETPKTSSSETLIQQYEADNQAGLKRVSIRGIAAFTQKSSDVANGIAYFNYAEIGTVLKITNLMSKKSVFVKVIGKLDKQDEERNIIVILSLEQSNELKVNEEKCLVETVFYSK